MAAYLEYVQELKSSFASFEVVHVPREHNARADLLAKLASSGKGGRQRTVIQETLKMPRAFVADHLVLQISRSMEKAARSHRSLTQETLRSPRIRACRGERVNMTQVCATHEPDTWITQYQRCLADGLLPLDPTKARKIKKNSSKFTMIDGELYRFGFTHPLSWNVCTKKDVQESWPSSMKGYVEVTSGGELSLQGLSVQVTTGQQ